MKWLSPGEENDDSSYRKRGEMEEGARKRDGGKRDGRSHHNLPRGGPVAGVE